ncbi:MAG: hypothetical protein JW939_08415 [Candidatus Thermoplasmatota archaeon]|nr:hypothetical protein [Candidatus Thermoplasmatota archaeon]
MKDRYHNSCRSVTEAHRNSNIIILRYDPPFFGKRGSDTTHLPGMKVTIVGAGPELSSTA